MDGQFILHEGMIAFRYDVFVLNKYLIKGVGTTKKVIIVSIIPVLVKHIKD